MSHGDIQIAHRLSYMKEWDHLFSAIEELWPVSQEFRDAVKKEGVPMSLPRNYVLLEAPRIADHLWFLDQGYAMTVTYVDGSRQVLEFWKAGEFIYPFASLFQHSPSMESIQLITKSRVICFSRASISELQETFPEAIHLERIFLHGMIDVFRKRLDDIRNLSTVIRYQNLIEAYPGLEQVVPQERIASFLGITPQSLSRIKRRTGKTHT